MLSTNETIAEVLKQLTNINQNLSHLANEKGGIVIHDTFANVSSWVELGITLFATITGAIIGGWITIILFKKQEKMRIKQELRLEFYKGYKPLYKKFIDEITGLKHTLNTAKYLYDSSGSAFELPLYNLDGSTKWVKQCNHKLILDKIVEIIKNTNEYIDKINEYLEENKIILNKYNGELYDKVGIELFLIKNKICELEKYHKEINIIFNRRYTVDKLIAEYEETVKYTIECESEIVKIIEYVKRIHSNLECEFLNQYFK